MRPVFVLLPLLALAACDRPRADDVQRATMREARVNIDAGEGNRAVAVTADGATGRVGLKLPGFDGSFTLPPQMFERANFDIDGVRLFPGSSVRDVDVVAGKRDAAGARTPAVVTVRFAAPAAPAAVAEWYAKAFADKGVSATRKGQRFDARTRDGNTVSLDLAPDGATTMATVRIVDAKG